MDIAREPEIADPFECDEFNAIELVALPAPVVLLDELEGVPRDSPADLEDIEELALPPPKFRATAGPLDLAELGELPNECH